MKEIGKPGVDNEIIKQMSDKSLDFLWRATGKSVKDSEANFGICPYDKDPEFLIML